MTTLTTGTTEAVTNSNFRTIIKVKSTHDPTRIGTFSITLNVLLETPQIVLTNVPSDLSVVEFHYVGSITILNLSGPTISVDVQKQYLRVKHLGVTRNLRLLMQNGQVQVLTNIVPTVTGWYRNGHLVEDGSGDGLVWYSHNSLPRNSPPSNLDIFINSWTPPLNNYTYPIVPFITQFAIPFPDIPDVYTNILTTLLYDEPDNGLTDETPEVMQQ